MTERSPTERPAEPRSPSGNGQPIAIGLVGFGRIAADYAAVLGELDDYRIAAVADLDTDRQAAASTLEVPVYANVEKMLAEEQLDAALILTPPSTHVSIALRLLQSRCHVLCEKPLAVDGDGAGHMLAAAHRHGRVLMMASKFVFVEDVDEARALIADGTIGNPVFYDNQFCGSVDMTERWNSDPERSGGGVLIDHGPHAVDLARALLGNVVRVFATFGRRTQPIRVEDSVRVQLEAFGGAIGTAELSWSIDRGNEYYATVCGSRGTLQLGWKGSRYKTHTDPEWRAFGSGYDKRRAFTRQLEHFARVVRGQEESRITRDDMYDSVRFIEAAYRSAMVSRWVPVLSNRR